MVTSSNCPTVCQKGGWNHHREILFGYFRRLINSAGVKLTWEWQRKQQTIVFCSWKKPWQPPNIEFDVSFFCKVTYTIFNLATSCRYDSMIWYEYILYQIPIIPCFDILSYKPGNFLLSLVSSTFFTWSVALLRQVAIEKPFPLERESQSQFLHIMTSWYIDGWRYACIICFKYIHT